MDKHDYSKSEVIKCFHCGNETLMHQKGEHKWGSKDFGNDDFQFHYKIEMFVCPVCHGVSLRQTYGDESMMQCNPSGKIEWYEEKTIIFPINSLESDSVPSNIKEAFEGALKVREIDTNLYIIGLRRTLELILNDKGATKRGLKAKIEEIAGKGILPEALKEASSITKMFGDAAAHDKDVEIDMHDVRTM